MVKEQNRLYSLLSFLLILGLFLTVNLRANASTTYQESEPNNTQQNANQLINGQYTFGKISSDGDKDWYVLNVLSPGDIRATLEDLPADYDLYLYDQNLTRLKSSISSGGESETINYEAKTKGKYYLEVVGSRGKYSSTHSYKIMASYPSEPPRFNSAYEPNNTKENAYSIKSGIPYRAKIESPLDIDFYKIKTKKAGQIRITLENLPFDYDLYLYDKFGQRLASSTNGKADDEEINFNAMGADIYYIAIKPTKDYFSTNSSYTLKAFFPSDVKFKAGMEPNDIKEMAYPIISGKKYTAKLETALDRDYYKLNVEKEGTIYARLENLPYDYDLKLLDKHGNTIKSSLTGLNKPEALQFYAREKGTYYIYVFPTRDKYSTKYSYTLQVTYPTKKVTHHSKLESNDTMESAYLIKPRVTYSETINSPIDIDWFKFKATSGKKVKISLTSLPYDYELYLYDKKGNKLNRSLNGGTKSEYIHFKVPKTSYYYILVRPARDNYSLSKKYRLKVG